MSSSVTRYSVALPTSRLCTIFRSIFSGSFLSGSSLPVNTSAEKYVLLTEPMPLNARIAMVWKVWRSMSSTTRLASVER